MGIRRAREIGAVQRQPRPLPHAQGAVDEGGVDVLGRRRIHVGTHRLEKHELVAHVEAEKLSHVERDLVAAAGGADRDRPAIAETGQVEPRILGGCDLHDPGSTTAERATRCTASQVGACIS